MIPCICLGNVDTPPNMVYSTCVRFGLRSLSKNAVSESDVLRLEDMMVAKVAKQKFTCPVCEKDFYMLPYDVKRRNYCSCVCANLYLRGPNHPHWRGGRVLDNGYIRTTNPITGYYGHIREHRLVMSQILGRPLDKSEHVHHINGNRSDNRPENLKLMTLLEHRCVHRYRDNNLRMPGEENPIVLCLCGCGRSFLKYTPDGMPRRYIHGHNRRAARETIPAAAGNVSKSD